MWLLCYCRSGRYSCMLSFDSYWQLDCFRRSRHCTGMQFVHSGIWWLSRSNRRWWCLRCRLGRWLSRHNILRWRWIMWIGRFAMALWAWGWGVLVGWISKHACLIINYFIRQSIIQSSSFTCQPYTGEDESSTNILQTVLLVFYNKCRWKDIIIGNLVEYKNASSFWAGGLGETFH